MKKLFTFFSVICGSYLFAQTSFNLYNGTTTNVPISNGEVIPQTTVADGESIDRIKIKNMSATQHSYTVKRTIVYQAPLLNVSGTTVTPNTYFCFGNTCFGNSTSQPGPSDYTILLPAAQTSTDFPYSDDSDLNGQIFKIYMEEGSTVGKYYVSYKVWNVNNVNDSMSFTLRYNEFLGVNSIPGSLESVSDIYPNPTGSNASLNITMKHESDVKLAVYNTLGSSIYSGTVKCVAGKNKLPIDCSALNNGMYFVTIQSAESKITKRLIINK